LEDTFVSEVGRPHPEQILELKKLAQGWEFSDCQSVIGLAHGNTPSQFAGLPGFIQDEKDLG
jgi:hypothetical protein